MVRPSRRRSLRIAEIERARNVSSGSPLLQRPEIRAVFEDADCRRMLIHSLLECRTSAGISQERVAERMGTTQSAVSDLEGGATDPRLSTLQRYARSVDARLWVTLDREMSYTQVFGVTHAAEYQIPTNDIWFDAPSSPTRSAAWSLEAALGEWGYSAVALGDQWIRELQEPKAS
jgi:transcriptional regulator with XRE-family HTH domain